MSQNNLTEEDYLRLHLESLERNDGVVTPIVQPMTPKMDTTRTSDLEYFNFDIQEFPSAIFYPKGTLIQVRAAQVKEVQAYSMVDDTNYYDIVEKMNDMLSSCSRIKYPDGTIATFLDLKDTDRYYLIFLIRELTFQKGTTLSTTAKCKCGLDTKIELVRENFLKHEINQKIKPYYNQLSGCFTFELTNNKVYHLSPPTIGLQKAFTEYIITENLQKRKPNLSFLKIIPFTLPDRKTITQDEIKELLENFQKIDDVSFQFLNSAVDKMTFGIEKLRKFCQCGQEIHTKMVFPDGPSAIFVIHDAFDKFIKK